MYNHHTFKIPFHPFVRMAVTFDAWNMPQEPAPSPAASQKKPRHRHAPHQLAALNELFDQNEHPPLEQRTALAERLGMCVATQLLHLQRCSLG